MKYNSIGEQLIAKAKELDPNYKPDKFNDISEALDIILNNSGGGSSEGGDIWLDITPYINEDMASISQEGYDLIYNNFTPMTENPINKYVGIVVMGEKLIFNGLTISDSDSDKIIFNFILNLTIDGVKAYIKVFIDNNKSIEMTDGMDSSSNKIWFDVESFGDYYLTEEQYNTLVAYAKNNLLAGIRNTGVFIPLQIISDINSDKPTLTFEGWWLSLGLVTITINGEDRKVKDSYRRVLMSPKTSPSSQVIPSIRTSNEQENLTIGDGLKIENGVLKTNNIPALPSDANTKTYTLQAVNGRLIWTDVIGNINTILDNVNGEVI